MKVSDHFSRQQPNLPLGMLILLYLRQDKFQLPEAGLLGDNKEDVEAWQGKFLVVDGQQQQKDSFEVLAQELVDYEFGVLSGVLN